MRKKDLERKKKVALEERTGDFSIQAFNKEAFMVSNRTSNQDQLAVFHKQDGFDIARWSGSKLAADNLNNGKNPEETGSACLDRGQPSD